MSFCSAEEAATNCSLGLLLAPPPPGFLFLADTHPKDRIAPSVAHLGTC